MVTAARAMAVAGLIPLLLVNAQSKRATPDGKVAALAFHIGGMAGVFAAFKRSVLHEPCASRGAITHAYGRSSSAHNLMKGMTVTLPDS